MIRFWSIGREPKNLPNDQATLIQFVNFIKDQAKHFEKHDHLVDTIAGDLNDGVSAPRERLELVRYHLV